MRGVLLGLVTTVTVGCAGASPRPTTPDDARRQPDGVAIDPASAPPPARDKAGADEHLVTLRTPLGIDLAMATVTDFFQRVVREDADALEGMFTKDALVINAQGPSQPGQQSKPQQLWGLRFHRLDYTKLAGEVVFREGDVSVFRADDVLDTGAHPNVAADQLLDGDVVVHVPIVTPRVGQDRLFADEMTFWLRREGGQYKIYRMLDEFQLP